MIFEALLAAIGSAGYVAIHSLGAWGRAMNATAWARIASLVPAECITKQRRRDEAQPKLAPGELRGPSQDIAAGGMFHWSANAICWPGRPDIFGIFETIKDRGAFIKAPDEPIIDTTSVNMWVEAFRRLSPLLRRSSER